MLNHRYESSLILLLEPDHIVFDVITIEEFDQLRIVPRSNLSQIMCKQEELRRKGVYLKILYSNDPMDTKTSPLDIMKGTSERQKLGEEFTAKKPSAIEGLKRDMSQTNQLDYPTISMLTPEMMQGGFTDNSSGILKEHNLLPRKWERIDRTNIKEESKVVTPGMQDIYDHVGGIKDREELISILKTITIQKNFKVFLPHSETINKRSEAKTIVRCTMCLKSKVR